MIFKLLKNLELEQKKKEEKLLEEQKEEEIRLANLKLKAHQESVIKEFNAILQPTQIEIDNNQIEPPLITSSIEFIENQATSKENINIDNNTTNINNNNVDEEKNTEGSLSPQKDDANNDENKNEEDDDIYKKKFKITNPKFTNEFLELWKKRTIEKELQQSVRSKSNLSKSNSMTNTHEVVKSSQNLIKSVIDINNPYNDSQYASSIISSTAMDNQVQVDSNDTVNKNRSNTSKSMKLNYEELKKNLKYVFEPNQVLEILQKSEVLNGTYFNQLQKYVEGIITSNILSTAEKIENVNNELIALKESQNQSTSNNKKDNKKDAKNDNKKDTKSDNKKDNKKNKVPVKPKGKKK